MAPRARAVTYCKPVTGEPGYDECMSETTFDYIIVGAGYMAKCLLANWLSANASKRVLLIEAGRKDDYHWIHYPVGYLYCIGNPRTDWLLPDRA